MPEIKKIQIGQGVRVRGSFRDPATRDLLDPGEVSVEFRRPDNTIVTVPTDRDDVGRYSGRVVVDQDGMWFWRIASAAPGEAAKEGYFDVSRSQFLQAS